MPDIIDASNPTPNHAELGPVIVIVIISVMISILIEIAKFLLEYNALDAMIELPAIGEGVVGGKGDCDGILVGLRVDILGAYDGDAVVGVDPEIKVNVPLLRCCISANELLVPYA